MYKTLSGFIQPSSHQWPKEEYNKYQRVIFPHHRTQGLISSQPPCVKVRVGVEGGTRTNHQGITTSARREREYRQRKGNPWESEATRTPRPIKDRDRLNPSKRLGPCKQRQTSNTAERSRSNRLRLPSAPSSGTWVVIKTSSERGNGPSAILRYSYRSGPDSVFPFGVHGSATHTKRPSRPRRSCRNPCLPIPLARKGPLAPYSPIPPSL